MAADGDLGIVAQQEAELSFERFDEDAAFELGRVVRETAKALGRGGIVTGVYLWDRTLFFGATAGSADFHRGWVERKVKLVRLMQKSSYRVVLERGEQPRVLTGWALEAGDYAIAGGAFPIKVRNVGIIGAAATSGLPERDDHEVSRGAIALALGQQSSYLALPAP